MMREFLSKIALIATLLSCIFSCTSRHHLENGIVSFRQGNYRNAFIYLKPEAMKGHPDAQYAVGYMYYYGVGVIENKEEAKIWIARAADRGQPEAIKARQILKIS